MIKDILAVVQGGAIATPAARYAFDFAGIHHAHLGLTVVTERIMLTAAFDPMGAYFPEPECEEEHARDLAAMRALADEAPIECDVRGLCEEPLFIPGKADLQSRCADLVLIGPEPCWSDRRLRRKVVDAILLDAGAPVLLHPPGASAKPFDHAVLGWNESAEAARAARALSGCLQPEATVDVVIVEPLYTPDGRSSEPGREIVNHFARHGFRTELHVCPRGERPVAEVLETFATKREAQILAVGAYAHSRLRELVFGGVTRELIDFQRLPVLMVH